MNELERYFGSALPRLKEKSFLFLSDHLKQYKTQGLLEGCLLQSCLFHCKISDSIHNVRFLRLADRQTVYVQLHIADFCFHDLSADFNSLS